MPHLCCSIPIIAQTALLFKKSLLRKIISGTTNEIINLKQSTPSSFSSTCILMENNFSKSIVPFKGIELSKNELAQLNEPAFMFILCEAHQKKGIMVDVGAHYGGSLSPFAEAGWKVLAFEPDPKNREQLTSNPIVQKNDVEVIAAAIGKQENDEVPIYASTESTGVSGLIPFLDTHQEICRVPLLTLKTEIRNRNLATVDFLKVDVEGCEMDVLQGLDFEDNSPHFLMLEYEDFKTDGQGYQSHDLCDILEQNGYHILVSEWWPIVKYGGRHSWRRIYRYKGNIPKESWGNIIAFKKNIPKSKIEQALIESLESSPTSGNTITPKSIIRDEAPTLEFINSFPRFILRQLTQHPTRHMVFMVCLLAIGPWLAFLTDSIPISILGSSAYLLFYTGYLILSYAKQFVLYIMNKGDAQYLRLKANSDELNNKFAWLKTNSELERRKLAINIAKNQQIVSAESQKLTDFSAAQVKFNNETVNSLKDKDSNLLSLDDAIHRQTKNLDDTKKSVKILARAEVKQRVTNSFSVKSLAKTNEKVRQSELEANKQFQISFGENESLKADLEDCINELDGTNRKVQKVEDQVISKNAEVNNLSEKIAETVQNLSKVSTSFEKKSSKQINLIKTLDGSLDEVKKSSESIQDDISEIHTNTEGISKELNNKLTWLKTNTELERRKLAVSIAKNKQINEMFLKTSSSNVAIIRQHQRFLSSADIQHFIIKWSAILKVEVTAQSLSYLAFQIGKIEEDSLGRLATDISTSVLRTMALKSLGKKKVETLEIGTLFGISSIIFNRLGSVNGNKIHLSIIDPLTGYYDKGSCDPITGIPVSKATLDNNLLKLKVPKNEFRILQGLSQDNEILRLASEKSYDYLLIDGDHSYEGVKRDFDLYFELMSKNSLILFDDYNTPEWPQIQQYVDDEVFNREDLEFVGADWRTAIFRKL